MKDIDIHRLAHLYYGEKKTTVELAEIFGCSLRAIYKCMDAHGMKRRSKSEAKKLAKARKSRVNLDIEDIVRLYFQEHLTLGEVGTRLGVTGTTVRTRLIAAGYTPRSVKEAQQLAEVGQFSRFTDTDRAEMKRLYCEEEQSLAEIADRYNCSDVTVRAHLKEIGVRLRTYKEAWDLRRKKAEGKERKPKRKVEPRGKVSREPPIPPEAPARTYTPPKRFGKVFEPIPLLSPAQVTPERILQLREDEELTVDDIAVVCSLSRVDIYNILQKAGGI